jgi:hypothetical protein
VRRAAWEREKPRGAPIIDLVDDLPGVRIIHNFG